MNIQVENLERQGYRYLEVLPHSDLGVFLKPYLFRWNLATAAYGVFTIVPLLVWAIIVGFHLGQDTLNAHLLNFFTGFSFAFLAIPLHEYIHGLAYRYVGAKKVSYGADLKKFVFYALADKFVANTREFKVVALAPFIVITTLAIALLFFVPTSWAYAVLGFIFVHSLFCGGDFGLLSYLLEHPDKEIVTYDDVANKASYFYQKINA